MSAAKNPAPSGSVIPEMSNHRLIEYRGELLTEIAAEYTAQIAMTTSIDDFMALKGYCQRRLGEVHEEIVKRFIELQEQINQMYNNADYSNHN